MTKKGKGDYNVSDTDDHSGDDDDSSIGNANNTAIDDSSHTAAADSAVNASATGTTSSTSKKRTAIDESTLSAEDLQKLESRRAYNRHCAAKARKRNKTQIAQLQSQVEELTKDKAELKRSNDLMRTQLDLLEQQNRTLLMNQLSSQTSPQLNTGRTFLGSSSLGGIQSGGVGGNPLFNLQQNGIGPASVGSGGNNILAGASNTMPFLGSGGSVTSNPLASMSLLERLRLQQQLQQQQQLGLMSQSGSGSNTSHDVMLNTLRNNNNGSSNNNSNNFLG